MVVGSQTSHSFLFYLLLVLYCVLNNTQNSFLLKTTTITTMYCTGTEGRKPRDSTVSPRDSTEGTYSCDKLVEYDDVDRCKVIKKNEHNNNIFSMNNSSYKTETCNACTIKAHTWTTNTDQYCIYIVVMHNTHYRKSTTMSD